MWGSELKVQTLYGKALMTLLRNVHIRQAPLHHQWMMFKTISLQYPWYCHFRKAATIYSPIYPQLAFLSDAEMQTLVLYVTDSDIQSSME